ncbi:MAG TPA: NfeD family protein [Acidimicrobiales bacterium]|nr:NfeD family protein [Acidimicrobiales bacterium]
MNDSESWGWLWLVAASVFAVGEMVTPGSFILLPFAIGAVLAAVLAFFELPVWAEWLAFVVASAATLAAFRPLSRRLDLQGSDSGVGSRRLLGQEGHVLTAIPGAGGLGLVRVDREEWRAESTNGMPIPSGAHVRVADVRGTRVVVAPMDTLTPGDEVRR